MKTNVPAETTVKCQLMKCTPIPITNINKCMNKMHGRVCRHHVSLAKFFKSLLFSVLMFCWILHLPDCENESQIYRVSCFKFVPNVFHKKRLGNK
jgi:hypothetical protein